MKNILFCIFLLFTLSVHSQTLLEEKIKSSSSTKEESDKLIGLLAKSKENFNENKKEFITAMNTLLKNEDLVKKLKDNEAVKEYVNFIISKDPEFKKFIENNPYTLLLKPEKKFPKIKNVAERFQNNFILGMEKFGIKSDNKNPTIQVEQEILITNQGNIEDTKILSIRVSGNFQINEKDSINNWTIKFSNHNTYPSAHISEFEAAIKATEKMAIKSIHHTAIYYLDKYIGL